MVDWEDVSDLVSFPKGARHGAAFKVTEDVFLKLTKKQPVVD
jgi:beta-galactosidase